jgi:hypothetical protein
VTGLGAPDFPREEVRRRARLGAAAAFPEPERYGSTVFGQPAPAPPFDDDPLDTARVVPPVFMPERLEKLLDLGREPTHADVDLAADVGGFASALPLYLSAFGSTRVANADLGLAASRQAGRLGIPMVIGENILLSSGYRGSLAPGLLDRIQAYAEAAEAHDRAMGAVVVQQSTDDADAEVWNLVYSDPRVQPLLDSGRLGFELKTGQGAKPGLGGMTLLDPEAAAKAASQYLVESVYGESADRHLRSASPGTFTAEILARQIQLMRNNFPRARVWVKLHPGRDVGAAAETAWRAGADAVAVDGAAGGTGWAPTAFLRAVGLTLGECLLDIHAEGRALLASSRMYEGTRVLAALALGATAAGLGRAALVAVDADPEQGLIRLAECLRFELSLLISALGKYRVADVSAEDVRLRSR